MRKRTSVERLLEAQRVIGGNINRLRLERGMSMGELSKLSCVSKAYISILERGEHSVSIDKLVDLADGLDVPITKLIEGV